MADVLVVGSEGGIGRAFCDQAEKQCKLVLKLDINAKNDKFSWQVDTSNISELVPVLKSIENNYELPSTVVACPGLYLRQDITCYDEQQIETVWRANFLATTNIINIYLTHFTQKSSGYNFILVSSLAGHFGGLDAYYAASKAAVMAFAKSIAREYQHFRARVNVVAPGPVDTPMASVMDTQRKDHYCKQIPIGRFAQPEEVASLIDYLCFNAPPTINGAVYDIDGGLLRR